MILSDAKRLYFRKGTRVLRRLDFIVIMRRFASLRSFNSLKSSGASRKTVINCFSLAYLLPLPKIDKFRQKLVDFYFFTITSSLFTKIPLSIFGK